MKVSINGPQTTVAAGWTLISPYILLDGSVKTLVIDVENKGGNAFTAFRLTRATAGGTHRQWLSGTDFNTATVELVDAVSSAGSPPNIATLAASGWAQVKLEHVEGTAEIGVWAQSTGGTSAVMNATGN